MDRRVGPDPVARARELAGELAAAADAIESTRRIPDALLARLHAARMYRMLLPRSLDGDEVEPGHYVLTLEEIARHDASVAWNVFVGNSAALIAPYLEPATARTIFADPCAIVAWGPPNATQATAVPGGYRVTGTWSFASGCRNATWMGVHCQVVEPDGTLRLDRAGRATARTLLFPAAQATLIDSWHTIGLRGTASDSYRLCALFVSEAHTGTREDPAARREPGPLYAFTMQGLYAMGVAGVGLGIAGAMLAELSELAGRKSPRGLERMADSTPVQAGVAEAEAKLRSARAYVLSTLADIHARANERAPIEVPDRARVRLAATHAIHAAVEVADFVYKAAGVDSIFPGGPFERRFRDMHTVSQQIQSRDAHYETVGQVLLGNPPEVFL
ncbi:MAG TPA: acyl-CoA dehydrogenase family protein [Alphaproteobacteria bacterium]